MPSISIDYAVMEPATRGVGSVMAVPLDCGWTDLGSWEAIRQQREELNAKYEELAKRK